MSCESTVEGVLLVNVGANTSIPFTPCRDADINDGSAEREALDGTVRGFESWIDGWRKQHEQAVATRSIQKSRQKKWTKRKTEDPIEGNIEALLDGISAWMRGWEDVQEGFRNREQERRSRREERRKVPSETDKGKSPAPPEHPSE